MIGLDTKVLIRQVVADDKSQTARAASCIEAAIQRGEKLYICLLVLCELVWMLKAAYRRDRSDIGAVVSTILKS